MSRNTAIEARAALLILTARVIILGIDQIVNSAGTRLSACGPTFSFVNQPPGLKILSLSFLYLVGVALVADGLSRRGPQGCISGYSVFAEVFRPQAREKTNPVQLHIAYLRGEINHTNE